MYNFSRGQKRTKRILSISILRPFRHSVLCFCHVVHVLKILCTFLKRKTIKLALLYLKNIYVKVLCSIGKLLVAKKRLPREKILLLYTRKCKYKLTCSSNHIESDYALVYCNISFFNVFSSIFQRFFFHFSKFYNVFLVLTDILYNTKTATSDLLWTLHPASNGVGELFFSTSRQTIIC